MSEQVYVPDDERDAILDRLASQPENKVLSLFIIADMFWLQKQEPQVGFL